jgi:hypothetical protein
MKGSTRGKSEKQASEGQDHVSWPENVSKSNGRIGGTTLLDSGVRNGKRRQHRTK